MLILRGYWSIENGNICSVIKLKRQRWINEIIRREYLLNERIFKGNLRKGCFIIKRER